MTAKRLDHSDAGRLLDLPMPVGGRINPVTGRMASCHCFARRVKFKF